MNVLGNVVGHLPKRLEIQCLLRPERCLNAGVGAVDQLFGGWITTELRALVLMKPLIQSYRSTIIEASTTPSRT